MAQQIDVGCSFVLPIESVGAILEVSFMINIKSVFLILFSADSKFKRSNLIGRLKESSLLVFELLIYAFLAVYLRCSSLPCGRISI